MEKMEVENDSQEMDIEKNAHFMDKYSR